MLVVSLFVAMRVMLTGKKTDIPILQDEVTKSVHLLFSNLGAFELQIEVSNFKLK